MWKPWGDVVELNRHHQVVIHYPCHRLPQDFHYIDSLVVAVPIWEKYVSLLVALIHNVTLTEDGLYQPDDLLPVCGVKLLIPR